MAGDGGKTKGKRGGEGKTFFLSSPKMSKKIESLVGKEFQYLMLSICSGFCLWKLKVFSEGVELKSCERSAATSMAWQSLFQSVHTL